MHRRGSGRRGGRGRRGLGHRGSPYRRGLLAASILWLALLARGADADGTLAPDGVWHAITVRSPGGRNEWRFPATSGCRYRVQVAPGTLARPVFELRSSSALLVTVDPGASGVVAEHDFHAERDDTMVLRIGGFSAMTGDARLRVETLAPDGTRTTPHRRFLAEGGVLARVGELWIGEANRWEVVGRAGTPYEVVTTPGTASRVVVKALAPDGELVATSEGRPGAFPRLRFRLPAPLELVPPAKPALPVIEVRAAGGGGGTYGVRLHALPDAAELDPPAAAVAEPVTRGPIDDVPLGFRANAGDVAVLFLPKDEPWDPHGVQARLEGGWRPLPEAEISPYGERAAVRTPELSALVVFRAHANGEYRFVPYGASGQPVLRVYDGAEVGGAPLLLGSGLDPTILARSQAAWRTIGLGLVMPGGDYLFVAVGSGPRDLALRVRSLSGATLAQRGGGAPALTEVPGMGPSLRFRVKEPQAVRLEVKTAGWRGSALLRRASN